MSRLVPKNGTKCFDKSTDAEAPHAAKRENSESLDPLKRSRLKMLFIMENFFLVLCYFTKTILYSSAQEMSP